MSYITNKELNEKFESIGESISYHTDRQIIVRFSEEIDIFVNGNLFQTLQYNSGCLDQWLRSAIEHSQERANK